MAIAIRVEPAYNGKIAVQSNNSLNGTILSNSLTQEVLLSIYQNQPELRGFLYTEYTTVGGSYAPSDIDPSLIHAYDSSELTHNPAKNDYPANTVGKAINDNKASFDALAGGFVRPVILPSISLNFARAKTLHGSCVFSRASTASFVNAKGLIQYSKSGEPRFTHDPFTKESLGILLEESRTNYYVNSTAITSGSNLTKTLAQLAPDGTATAVGLVKNGTANDLFYSTTLPTLADGFYTRSVFVKANNVTSAIIAFEGIGDVGSGGSLTFDLLLKTFSGSTAVPYEYGYKDYADGWMRVWVVCEKSATKVVGHNIYVGGFGGNNANTHSILVWGMQIEDGKSVSTYIPTTGTSITRSADLLSLKNIELPRNAITMLASGVIRGKWEKSQNGRNRILCSQTTGFLSFRTDGVVEAYDSVNTLSATNTNENEINAVYSGSATKRRVCISGNTVFTVTNNADTAISGGSDLAIGSGSGGGNFLNGTIKRICIYAAELTDAELILLTKKGNKISDTNEGVPSAAAFSEMAFIDKKTDASLLKRQEFSFDGTGASITRNIRRPYNFTFEIVDNSGVTTMTATPAANCVANTDNPLTFTAPVGKTLTYAIVPVVYEY